MEHFYKIGSAVLLQAIGIKKNVKTAKVIREKVLDTEKSGCNNCISKEIASLYKDTCNNSCNTCSKAVYKTIEKEIVCYDNEKNRYGSLPSLSHNAIKVLLILHTFHPDANGFLKEIPISTLAKKIGCTSRTIRNSLNQLQKKEYLSFSRITKGEYSVHLTSYKNYFLPATAGGRGYITLSSAAMEELLASDSLLALRLSLRSYVEISALGGMKSSFNCMEKSYHDMRLSLPKYCKPNILNKIALKKIPLLNVSICETGLRFHLPDDLNPKKKLEVLTNQYTAQWNTFLDEFNKEVPLLNTNKITLEQFKHSAFLAEIQPDSEYQYRIMAFHQEDLKDIVSLTLEYDFAPVLHSLKEYYKTYLMQGKKYSVHNLGGLLRTLLRSFYTPIQNYQTFSNVSMN